MAERLVLLKVRGTACQMLSMCLRMLLLLLLLTIPLLLVFNNAVLHASGSRCALIDVQVHWLRVLIDEGHSLGASLGLTYKLDGGYAGCCTNPLLPASCSMLLCAPACACCGFCCC